MVPPGIGSTQTAPAGERLGPPTLIDEPLVAAIVKRLETGKSIRRTLPSGGYLHIDRQLPFLLVYRRSASEEDPAIDQLLRGESSYLLVNSQRRFNKGLVNWSRPSPRRWPRALEHFYSLRSGAARRQSSLR